ncbi:protein toll-like [Wyeomyia smithii]|uniref:protein toll-like n=1 Tax=Wyeomyia smithii TaxID=174621 RepID=UPI002467FD91|nr:protein toll-like [Wyeomyia smithii]
MGMGANKVVLVLVALLTHNLVSSSAASGNGGVKNGSEPRFTCPEPTPNIDCSCMYVYKDYEIQCPVFNPKITVNILSEKYVHIQCYEKYEFSGMPMLTVGNTDQVKIRHCPLPQRQSIRQFISFLGVGNIKDFWYQNFDKDSEVRLIRQHFEGMQDLEKLYLTNVIADIQPDLFADLPSLKWLILRSNLVKLMHNVFDNLTNLIILELGGNQITELEPGLFKNQHKLRHLNLFNNKLRNITKDSFRGAEALEGLDLSVNAIESLQQDVFSGLPNLSVLNLSINRFVILPELLLANNRKLEDFKLNNNQVPLQTLPENFLSNLMQLKDVKLQGCSFTNLPASLFRGSTDITDLDLSYNQLILLPELLLRDQLELQNLNLAYNELETLPERLFENTKELLTLQLSFNRLHNLSATVFASLTKLTVLNLDNNHLHVIDHLTFSRTHALEKLYMQNNQLSFGSSSYGKTPFQYLTKLSVLNLRNNSITTIFGDLLLNNLQLRELDLSYNNIPTLSYLDLQFLSQDIRVNLSHNRISEIYLKDMEPIITAPGQSDKSKIRVDVNDNPLNCDCIILSFVQYLLKKLDKAVYNKVTLEADRLYCAEPKEHRGSLVDQLQTKDLLCPLDKVGTRTEHCPAKCSCFVRSLDWGVIVNCTGQGLLEVPPLPQSTWEVEYFLELHIEDNNITQLPTENLTGYAKVAELYAHNNAISQLEPENLPSGLRILDITKNRLTMLNQTVVEVLNASKQLESLRLSDNKWSCDCASTQFLNFVQQNHKRIGDIGKVTCADGKEFDSITINDLCHGNITLIITISVVLSILGLLIGLFTVLYFTYHMEIKVWLFMHNLCMCWVSEEELDKDKLYDAFISYSHKDEDFITEHLVTTLEKEPMNFKTCWHVRDFMPGELIPTQIAKSVEDSRRTIVVFSKNFQESVWARMEFRTAHLNAMAENRARVIVIIYDDELDMEHMDTELKAYLKMNTYVKWGDPWFWNKLRYAMPHPPAVKGLKGKGLIINNIKSSIDDQLELVKPVLVTPQQNTTPHAEMNGKRTPVFTISNGGSLMKGLDGNGLVNTNAKQSDV